MATDVVYSVDASSLIDWHERHYGPHIFPTLPDRIDTLVEAGRFLVTDQVFSEVTRKKLPAGAWCKPREAKIVVPTNADIVRQVRRLLVRFPRLAESRKVPKPADPFVIAVALVRNAVVVTGEGPDGTENRPKIPLVCKAFDVECITFRQLIEREGWTFQ